MNDDDPSKAHYSTRREVETQLIIRAWKDPDFRKRLASDPRKVLESEFSDILPDGRYPEGIELHVLEEDAKTKYIVIPQLPGEIAHANTPNDTVGSYAAAGTCIDLTYVPPQTQNLCTLVCPTVLTCPEVCD